jgi:hypothetical protein
MKAGNIIIIIIIAISLLGGCAMLPQFLRNREAVIESIPDTLPQKMPDTGQIVLEYDFLGGKEYMDNPHHHDMLLLEPGEPFTMSLTINTYESLKSSENEYHFTGPSNFVFDNSVLFLSFGREIKGLECSYDLIFRAYTFTITYEKEYQGNKVFLYRVEKHNYVPPDFYCLCYWIEDEEKVFIGDQYALVTFQK